MRGVALLSLLLLAACDSSSGRMASVPSPATSPLPPASASAPASPSPAPSPAPSPSPSAPASPTPAAGPPPHLLFPPFWQPPKVGGQCYLPVLFPVAGATSLTVEFFDYPYSAIEGRTELKVTGSPFYYPGATYDHPAYRWLPVPAEAISPDGLSFAFADYDLPPSGMSASNPVEGHSELRSAGVLATTGRVYLIDARTGSYRILYKGSPTYSVVGFTQRGIYLTQVALTMDGAFSSGLYLLGTTGGTPQPVAGGNRPLDGGGWTVTGGAAWGTNFTTGGGIAGGNQLVRLDLTTGAVTVWMTRAEGVGVSLIGVDGQGEPIVLVFASGYSSSGSPPPAQATEVWVMTAPDTGTTVYQNADPTATLPGGPTFTDSNGVWLSGAPNGEVWLYQPRSSALTAVTVAGSSTPVVPGGTCL